MFNPTGLCSNVTFHSVCLTNSDTKLSKHPLRKQHYEYINECCFCHSVILPEIEIDSDEDKFHLMAVK